MALRIYVYSNIYFSILFLNLLFQSQENIFSKNGFDFLDCKVCAVWAFKFISQKSKFIHSNYEKN